MGGKDDATGYVWAHFEEAETTWGYLDLMREVITTHGIALSLYADRHSISHTTREPTFIEQLKDVVPLTQFGRAMNELGITLIKAWTPQAKGRIERQWGTFQIDPCRRPNIQQQNLPHQRTPINLLCHRTGSVNWKSSDPGTGHACNC